MCRDKPFRFSSPWSPAVLAALRRLTKSRVPLLIHGLLGLRCFCGTVSAAAAFSASVKAISEKKREEDLKRKLLHEITELKIMNERVIRESVESETRVRSLVIKNEECLVQIKSQSY